MVNKSSSELAILREIHNNEVREQQQKAEDEVVALAQSIENNPQFWINRDDKLLKHIAAWETDLQRYHFGCRRRYDFLTVEISRNGTKLVMSLNLGIVNSITMTEGNPPDKNQDLSYYRTAKTKSDGRIHSIAGSIEFGNSWWHGDNQPNVRFRYFVWPDYPYLFTARPLFAIDEKEKNKNIYLGDDYNKRVQYVTKNYLRPTCDDTIVFSGVGALYVPATKGQDVLAMIMQAIEQGP